MMKDLAQIAQLMKGRNPQEVAMSMIKNSNIIDPTVAQLVQFAQTGDTNGLMNLAASMFLEQGLNLEEELGAFMSLLK